MQQRVIDIDVKNGDNTLSFKNIKIWDARPDTNSIGFLYYKPSVKTYRLVFEHGLASTLSQFANKTYTLNAEDTSSSLIVIIKKFRISEYVTISSIKDDNVVQWNSGIILSVELFLNSGSGYHALYKTDTTILAASKTQSISETVAQVFKIVFMKTENKKISEMHIGKTEFSYADVRKHAYHSYDYSILTDDELNKGVYTTFNEFKNNKPSIHEFEVKKGKFTDELFVTEGKQSYPLQNFWGYCDGQNIYIRSANNLFLLLRSGKTFNTKAIKSLSKRSGDASAEIVSALASLGGIPVMPQENRQYKGILTAFQLDMDTGEIY